MSARHLAPAAPLLVRARAQRRYKRRRTPWQSTRVAFVADWGLALTLAAVAALGGLNTLPL